MRPWSCCYSGANGPLCNFTALLNRLSVPLGVSLGGSGKHLEATMASDDVLWPFHGGHMPPITFPRPPTLPPTPLRVYSNTDALTQNLQWSTASRGAADDDIISHCQRSGCKNVAVLSVSVHHRRARHQQMPHPTGMCGCCDTHTHTQFREMNMSNGCLHS